MIEHCGECGLDPDAYWWAAINVPGIEGGVIVCREHGLPAPSEVYALEVARERVPS